MVPDFSEGRIRWIRVVATEAPQPVAAPAPMDSANRVERLTLAVDAIQRRPNQGEGNVQPSIRCIVGDHEKVCFSHVTHNTSPHLLPSYLQNET